MECYEFIVKGRVQGVGYRFFTQKRALLFNLKGYVQNLYNGDVKVVAIGSKEDLDNFLNQLWIGPSLAKVKAISKSKLDNCADYKDFSIKY